MMPYGDRSGPTLLIPATFTWQHQAITWTNVDFSSKVFCPIHLMVSSQDVLKNLIHLEVIS